ncbi:MAG: OmpA family protein [Bacteroidia bacterium]|nr:OmpA family protein [Bacteroidia bacterium]
MNLLHMLSVRSWLGAAGLLAALGGSAQTIDLGAGIVGYYPFNGSASDKSDHNHHGIVTGAQLTPDRFGTANSAYQFNGVDQQIRIPAAPSLDLTRSAVLSVSVWVQPRDENSGCILLKQGDFGIKWGGMQASTTFYAGSGSGYNNSRRTRWNSSEWYHLVIVQEQDRLIYYVNGAADQILERPRATQPAQQDLFIGAHPYFWGGFTGKIDDLCIYNRPLNSLEVETLYQLQNMPVEFKPKPAAPQVDVSEVLGTWQGILIQPGNSKIASYAYWITLERKNGKLTGYSRIEIPESQSYGVIMAEATLNANVLEFKEKQVASQKNYENFRWCMKYGSLVYDPKEKSLRGKWFANNCAGSGEIFLLRSGVPFNHFDNRLSPKVSLQEYQALLSSRTQDDQALRTLVLEPVAFQTGSAVITASSQAYLRQTLVPFMQSNPAVRIKISGHTDDIGDETLNLRLSAQRARAVAEFLTRAGIPGGQIQHEGFGESRPIQPNTTPEGRSANRRVEFEVFVNQ